MYDVMQSAGTTVFTPILKSWPNTKHILVLCGKGVIVVFFIKGAGSVISDGECLVINNSGNAGMGNELRGIISALVM